MNNFVKTGVLLVAAVLGGELFARAGHAPSGAGKAAPPLALPELRGGTVDLAKLRGKVVAVNFWATWCQPCRDEIPGLVEFWKENRGRCFEMLGVAEESTREDVKKMAAAMPYPILLDDRAKAVGPWNVPGYPMTYVLDVNGKVRQVFTGGVEKSDLDRAIRPLLPATCPAS